MFKYIFCLIFGIIRSRTFLVVGNHKIEVKIKNIPDILYYKNKEKIYKVNKVIAQPINKTLVYYWLHVEKLA